MRKVAYKIADGTKVASSLPSGWIVEHTFVDEQPEGSLNSEWLIIDEDKFQSLLKKSNSDKVMQAFKDAQHAEHQANLVELTKASEAAKAKLAKDYAEFEAFKEWKKTQ